MSIVLKTVRDRAISIIFWTLWVLLILDVMLLKNLNFLTSGHHLELWENQNVISKTIRNRAILSKFWTVWVL